MTGQAPIGPLASLPLFRRMVGHTAIVVGRSQAADWKAELLVSCGAKVVRLDHWTDQQLEGASLAVGDFSDRGEACAFAQIARRGGALVNIIDQPDLCDVQFGTIVNRSPVVIGISTDGVSPVLGQSIRARIEAVLPSGLAAWASAAKKWRPRLKLQLRDFSARRAFWQRSVAAFWAAPDTIADFDQLLGGAQPATGRVTLVGAGPGDAELLTLKAVRALQSATVILHDQLVGPEILELARREARRIPVGKRGRGPSCKQREINKLMVELALAGENVVRLKGGDPMVFGRAAEEIEACRAAGVDVSAIPGISAAQAAACSLLVSLTERRRARRVQFVTGHGADGRLPDDIDWISVADRAVTTLLYMPRHTLDEFVRKALSKGLDPATPAIAIASASLPEELHTAGPVAEIGALANLLPAGAPIVIVIGWVARRHVDAASSIVTFDKALAS